MAAINGANGKVSLPAFFRGVNLNLHSSGSVTYLL